MNFLRKIVKWLGILVLGFGVLLAVVSVINGKMSDAAILLAVFGLPGGILLRVGRGGSQKAQDEDGEPESTSSDTPSADESETDSEEQPTWSYDENSPESLIRRMFWVTSIGNGWFDWDDEKTIRFQDGTTIVTKMESIDDAGILLENFDEMRASRAKEIDGVSTKDNDAIMAALQGRDDMHHRIYTMDFSSSSEVQGTGGDMTVVFRTVQVGGEEVGEDIEISSDIDRDSLARWASREWRESEDEEGLLITGE